MLLNPDEITVAALMADLPLVRSAQNQLRMQLIALSEGLSLDQNPLQRVSPVTQHQVQAGDTLQIISLRLFQTPDYWRSLAEANNISYPYAVYPGQLLIVPEINA